MVAGGTDWPNNDSDIGKLDLFVGRETFVLENKSYPEEECSYGPRD